MRYRAFSARDQNYVIKYVRVQLVHIELLRMAARSLSSYALSLNEEAKARNRDKMEVIDALAPFGGCPGEPSESTPPHFITALQFEAYNQFVAG